MSKPDIEANLKRYLPTLFELLGNKSLKNSQWRKINCKFEQDFKERKKQFLANNNYLRVEANIYDVISSAITGDVSALGLMEYFSILFKRLAKNLSVDEKAKLRHTIYCVLDNLDHKYRNFIGELSVLNNLKENNEYTLISVEKNVISQNKTADFTLENNETSAIELVEVVNIHFDNRAPDLNKLLLDRINKKICDKTSGQSNYTLFTLVPVVWAPISDLKRLNSLYKSGEGLVMPRVKEPFAYCCFDGPEFPVHRFCPISEMFTDGFIEIIRA